MLIRSAVALRLVRNVLVPLASRAASEGSFKPSWMSRFRLKFSKLLNQEMEDDGLTIEHVAVLKGKRISDEQKKQPKKPLPDLDSMDAKALLDFYERTLASADDTKTDFLFHFYNSFNAKIPYIGKEDAVRFLRLSLLHRPKEAYQQEKVQLEAHHFLNSNDFLYSTRHKQLAEQNQKFMGLPFALAHHYAKHLSKLYHNGVAKEMADDELDVTSGDIVPSYATVFDNLEKMLGRFLGMNQRSFSTKELVSILSAFAQAQEGSDFIYESLGEMLLSRVKEFDIYDIDAFLNLFPHSIWKNQAMSGIKEAAKTPVEGCYTMMIEQMERQLPKAEKDLFFSLFQGHIFLDEEFTSTRTTDLFLHCFFSKVGNRLLSNEEILKFLELLCQFVESNEIAKARLDTAAVTDCVVKLHLSRIKPNTMSRSELSSYLWAFFRLGSLKDPLLHQLLVPAFEKLNSIDLFKCDHMTLVDAMEDAKLLLYVAKGTRESKYEKLLEGKLKDVEAQAVVH